MLSEPMGRKGGPGFWKEGIIEPWAKLLVQAVPGNLLQGQALSGLATGSQSQPCHLQNMVIATIY